MIRVGASILSEFVGNSLRNGREQTHTSGADAAELQDLFPGGLDSNARMDLPFLHDPETARVLVADSREINKPQSLPFKLWTTLFRLGQTGNNYFGIELGPGHLLSRL